MKVLFALLAALVLTSGPSLAQQGDGCNTQRVVYHLKCDGGTDDRAYRTAMRNIQNHIDAVGARNLDNKVVLHGDGLGLLMQAGQNDRPRRQVASLKGQNVGLQTCDKRLKSREISCETDLQDVREESVVPSGVAELGRLQQIGYAYIEP